jgi:hypothetical protein
MATKKPGSAMQKYGGYSKDDAEEDYKEAEKARSGKFLKIAVGKTRLRFIPPAKGKKWRRVTYQHFVDVPGQGRVSFVCPKMELKKPCPVCAKAATLMSSSSELDQKKGKKLMPQRRCYANVIVRGREEEGPMVFPFGPQVENQLIEMRRDEDMGGDFVDPIDGIDILIVREGTGPNDTKYKCLAGNKGKPLPLHEEANVIDEWFDSQPDLEQFCKAKSAEDIIEMLGGTGGRSRDDDEDDEDERPQHRRPATRGAGRTIDDELDSDDD